MKSFQLFAVTLLSAAVSSPGAAVAADQNPDVVGLPAGEPNVVLEWNAALCDAIEPTTDPVALHAQARLFAMMHLAMRDAMGEFGPAIIDPAKQAPASLAAATAARAILAATITSTTKPFPRVDDRYRTAVADPDAAARATKIGQRAAAAIVQRRHSDGWPVLVASGQASVQAGFDLLRQAPQASPAPSRRSVWAGLAPFGLKRVQQLEPESPCFVYSNGTVLPNERLRRHNRIGAPGDVAIPPPLLQAWRTLPLVQWNRVAQSLARRNPATVTQQARLFAALNTALGDALLAGAYWSDNYAAGRVDFVVDLEEGRAAFDGGPLPVLPGGAPITVAGFPALTAVLAGAAESILAKHFGGGEALFVRGAPASDGFATDKPVPASPAVSLHTAACECAWSMLADRTASPDGCMAGHELGARIGEYHSKLSGR